MFSGFSRMVLISAYNDSLSFGVKDNGSQKSSQFCGPLFLITKSTFFDGFAKIETERIQIILANSHSLLTKTLHLATETNLLVTETNGAHNQFEN